MITIFKNKKDIPLNKEYIELNDIFFNQNTATRLDDKAEKYIQLIDGSELISKYKIRSRFEDITLNIDQLSTGCNIQHTQVTFIKKSIAPPLWESDFEYELTKHIYSTVISHGTSSTGQWSLPSTSAWMMLSLTRGSRRSDTIK